MFGNEKRQHRRAPTSFSVEYKVNNTIGRCIATDISQSGMFLNISPPPEIGSRIYLSFILPGYSKLPPLKVVGKVVRIVSIGKGQIPGIGIEFDLIYAESRETIRSFIRKVLGPTVIMSSKKDTISKGKHFKLDYKNIAEKGAFERESSEEDEQIIKEFSSLKVSEIDTRKFAVWLKVLFIIGFTSILGYSLYIIAIYLLK